MIPLRWIFRSRWAALAWGIGICVSAVNFAGRQHAKAADVDAATAASGLNAAASALNAEDPE